MHINIQQMKSRSSLVLWLLEEFFKSAILTLQNSSSKREKLEAHQCIWSTDQDKGRGKEIIRTGFPSQLLTHFPTPSTTTE